MPVEEIAEALGVSPVVAGTPIPGPPPRYNVAPTQSMLVLRTPRGGEGRELAWTRWGLVPFWAPDLKTGNKFIQARSETVATSAAYRHAFEKRRCIVVVDGFYEWSHPKKKTDAKVPHLIRPEGGGILPIAGVWERWKPKDGGDTVESCAVLTMPAGPHVAKLHDRMPLVLRPHELETWLHGTPEEAREITNAEGGTFGSRDEGLVLVPVSTHVNNVKNDDAACIAAET